MGEERGKEKKGKGREEKGQRIRERGRKRKGTRREKEESPPQFTFRAAPLLGCKAY